MSMLRVLVIECCFCGLVFGQSAGSEAAKPVGPKLWLESTSIELGFIAVGQQEIEGVVR